jgi:hypothetical protein
MTPMKKTNKLSTTRLGTYLSLTLGAGVLGSHEADAKIINLDLTGYTGLNGGLASGSYVSTGNLDPNPGGPVITFNLFNAGYKGVSGGYSSATHYYTTSIAYHRGYASPVKFAKGASIGDQYRFSYSPTTTAFQTPGYSGYYGTYGNYTSPNFGPKSYLGFATPGGYCGWLEATWDGTDFQILSGAFQDDGSAIAAGDAGATDAVPEPSQVASSLLLLALGSAGVLANRRRKAASGAVAA